MKYVISEAIALLVGGVAAVFIMRGINSGELTPLFNSLASELGLSAATTTSVIRSLPRYISSGTTDQSGTTTASATVSSITQNWAGYEAASGNYTAISGTWTVPGVSASSSDAANATWIGIGGSGTQDLIQIGTENTIVNGQDQLVAFYETLPDYAQPIESVSVSPGDAVNANLTETGIDVWTLTLHDTTTGQSFSTSVNYNSSNSSAEWIEEAPSSTTAIMPLDNFGSVTFGGGNVTVNGQTESIAASGAQAISMENSSRELLTNVSTLNARGDGFTVTRTDALSSPATGTSIGRREPGFRRFRY